MWSRARQRDVIIAMTAGVVLMTPIVLGAVIPQFPPQWRWLPGLAWPWYVPLGTTVTVLVGMLSSLIPATERRNDGKGMA
jgi:solute:Na+ symporter, SSS family